MSNVSDPSTGRVFERSIEALFEDDQVETEEQEPEQGEEADAELKD